jgi:hypothetical protein
MISEHRPPLLPDTELAAIDNHVRAVDTTLRSGIRVSDLDVIALVHHEYALLDEVATLRVRLREAVAINEGRLHDERIKR